MAALKTFSAFIFLHGTFFLLVAFLILWAFERQRRRSEVAIMAVSAVAPFFILSYLALGAMMIIPSLGGSVTLVSAVEIKLILAFPILWLFFKVNARLALIYTILLLVAAQFSSVFARAVMQLFGGKPGAIFFLLVAVALPAVLWVVTRRIEDPARRMRARCVLIAALIAPTLVIGHGGAAILPAGMVWPALFQGGADMLIQLVSLAVSLSITTVVLTLGYKAIAKSQTEVRADHTEEP